MDATVTIEGDKGNTLRVKYIGFTRPTMFKLQEERKLIPDIIEASKAKSAAVRAGRQSGCDSAMRSR
jgi:hypothetical protein